MSSNLRKRLLCVRINKHTMIELGVSRFRSLAWVSSILLLGSRGLPADPLHPPEAGLPWGLSPLTPLSSSRAGASSRVVRSSCAVCRPQTEVGRDALLLCGVGGGPPSDPLPHGLAARPSQINKTCYRKNNYM